MSAAPLTGIFSRAGSRVAVEERCAPKAGSPDLCAGTSQVNAFLREENSHGTLRALTFLQVLCRRAGAG
ncbi:hypothetical protein [Kamptonema formosum]|uniref:hypothetical protein n=1 Tax=Kamptonema formosum TaxID=331992 RepID=UPI000477DCB9|nr:hypothetical protein [Oscillatoria sp. PCC 10802]